MAGCEEDLYFKKRISYSLNRQKFQFDTAELLFSTYEIDLGTQFLLRNMIGKLPEVRSILDLGCGYGVIGIVLAKFHPQARVLLSDKDLLAVRYSEHNVGLNQVPNVTVAGSIGIGDLPPQRFDLIVSNIPGHIGDVAITRDFVLDPLRILNPGGAYWFVIVTPLAELIQRIGLEHELPPQEVARRPGHVLYRIAKDGEGTA